MDIRSGSLVGFYDTAQSKKVYAQVYCQLEGDLVLVLDPEGRSYIAYAWGLHAPAERDSFGRTFWPPWTPGDPLDADPEFVRGATNELLRKPSVQRVMARIVSRRDRKLTLRRETCIGESWLIPYALCVQNGGYTELSPYFLAYLDREPDDRTEEEAALALLKNGEAGRGSARQYEVLMACHYGQVKMNWLADAWGVNRSTVWKQYHKGLDFIATYSPINNPRVKRGFAQRINRAGRPAA